jgi:hypothetical protein
MADALAERRASRLAGHDYVFTGGSQNVGDECDVRRLSNALEPFQCDESSAHAVQGSSQVAQRR